MDLLTGTEINYYFVCKHKLWLFTHGINMEHNSDYVDIGKVLHEKSFQREDKEILLDGRIKIDFVKNQLEIHETKKSKAIEGATKYQVLYYIYYLKKKGVDKVTGVIHYINNHSREEITLSEQDENKIKEVIEEINKIKLMDKPPAKVKSKICTKCSYYELCFS
ncbi:CRISPR-associated exonuclease, Cas4 family [Thermoanaerobacter uzonensis DSM 18761]|uniref:CRISPR-associated exonuclease Cas4 n=1 Tax=Thermoanaerobacter uzonensis DSM 18761 TaxID=1123369 RepID=A0A1M5AXB2_9THEO|nr:CRISPR-associated protein Cas4 [Thermoanaerobacter uzonensis]SHF34914.1 CRISPR-associated exonuclease, Cas4 family [Thermoanaerobacter uzonensis DSM 18761]